MIFLFNFLLLSTIMRDNKKKLWEYDFIFPFGFPSISIPPAKEKGWLGRKDHRKIYK